MPTELSVRESTTPIVNNGQLMLV